MGITQLRRKAVMSEKKEKEMHSFLDAEDISSQNLPHILPDKMAQKAFILVASLCFAFMAAAAVILTSPPNNPDTKPKASVSEDNR